jgi:hypothetical protein
VKIIELFIESKTGAPEDCEDGIFVGQHFIAVIDGVTSKGKRLWGANKVASGIHAKNVLMDALEGLKFDCSGEDAVQYLTDVLRQEYGGVTPANQREELLQAVIIIYSAFKKEIWIYGDCQCLVDGKHYFHEMYADKVRVDARAMYINALLKAGTHTVDDIKKRDEGREFIMPLLKNYLVFANSDCEYGYAVLNGVDLNLNLLEKVSVKSGAKVVLASDGYPRLYDRLEQCEQYLKGLIQRDPLLINEYKSFKCVMDGFVSFDDRAYISFEAE